MYNILDCRILNVLLKARSPFSCHATITPVSILFAIEIFITPWKHGYYLTFHEQSYLFTSDLESMMTFNFTNLVFTQVFLIAFPFKSISSALVTMTVFSQTVCDSSCTEFFISLHITPPVVSAHKHTWNSICFWSLSTTRNAKWT